MKKGRYYSKEEIIKISQSAIGKSFREIRDSQSQTVCSKKIQKGSLGGIIEEALFGIEPNGESEPDFIDAGIELKVTPYRKNKNNTLSAKERLVLNMIDYMEEYKNQFYTSHFWFKNKKLQIIWYLHEDAKNKLDLKITNEVLLDLALSEDIKQIEKDWNIVIDKIRQGKAHEISEGDTMYLGACTKGVNSESVREQPFSNIFAKKRAFCFKSSYMTQLVRKYIGNYSDVEKILTNKNEMFDDFVNKVVTKYKGKSQKELMEIFNIDSNAKNLNSMIVSRMFGVKGKLGQTDEFLKANIVPRTIRVEKNGAIKESMPFPAFEYKKLIEQEWENSDLRNQCESTKDMFFVFKMVDEDYIFQGIKMWNMPELTIDNEVRIVWERTKNVVASGKIVRGIDNRGNRITNFPGSSENDVCHVRPHAINSSDTFDLPVNDLFTGTSSYTKHCFWLNSKYLERILEEFL